MVWLYFVRVAFCRPTPSTRSIASRYATVEQLFITVLTYLQQWNGDYFRKESLATLGLTLQLGHTIGERCPHPSSCHQFTIFDLTGVHQAVIRYCTCAPGDGGYRRRQLLRSRLFPATFVHPQTVFSFRLLDCFHQLQSINKTNLYDFYNTIVRLSDNAGLSPPITSTPHFIFVAH